MDEKQIEGWAYLQSHTRKAHYFIAESEREGLNFGPTVLRSLCGNYERKGDGRWAFPNFPSPLYKTDRVNDPAFRTATCAKCRDRLYQRKVKERTAIA
jgi:hypothetical protein